MVCDRTAREDTLTPLLSDPKTRLEDVLSHSSLLPSLRCDEPSDKLIRFLLDQGNLDRMLTYALTNDLNSEANFTKMQKASVDILSTTSRRLQSEFQASPQLIEGLVNFSKSPASRDPKLCGNFAGIVELITRSTCGTILSTKMAFLKEFLLKNLDMVGLRELFLKLITDFSKQFQVNEAMITEICEVGTVDGIRGLFAVSMLNDILKEKADLALYFRSPRVLNKLLEIGCRFYQVQPVRAAIAFDVAKRISRDISFKATFCELLSKHKSPIGENPEINSATANTLLLFPKSAEFLFDDFFKFEMPTIVCQAFISVLHETEDAELKDLNALLMEHYDEFKRRKTNGHYLKFCQLLMNFGVCCCREHQDPWDKFVIDSVLSQGRLEAADYGGPSSHLILSLPAFAQTPK